MNFKKECNLSKYIAVVLKNKSKWNRLVPNKYKIYKGDNDSTIKWKIYKYTNENETLFVNENDLNNIGK
tara:strand:- start:2648 stop:2854 length:207 start_codon:yes stop_codon:yes gene_type:complete